jgi:hypothetical protein
MWLPGTGCHTAGDVPVCLRALTPEQLIRAYPVPVVVGGRRPPVSWGPVVDGKVLPQVPADALRGGTHHKVPIVIGSNSEETGVSTPLITTEAEYRAALTGLVGAALTDRAMMLYPSATYGSPRRALVQVTPTPSSGVRRASPRESLRAASPVCPCTDTSSLARSSRRAARFMVSNSAPCSRSCPSCCRCHRRQMPQSRRRSSVRGYASPRRVPTAGSLPRWPGVSAPEPFLQLDSVVTTGTGWRNAEGDFWDAVAGVMIPPPP